MVQRLALSDFFLESLADETAYEQGMLIFPTYASSTQSSTVPVEFDSALEKLVHQLLAANKFTWDQLNLLGVAGPMWLEVCQQLLELKPTKPDLARYAVKYAQTFSLLKRLEALELSFGARNSELEQLYRAKFDQIAAEFDAITALEVDLDLFSQRLIDHQLDSEQTVRIQLLMDELTRYRAEWVDFTVEESPKIDILKRQAIAVSGQLYLLGQAANPIKGWSQKAIRDKLHRWWYQRAGFNESFGTVAYVEKYFQIPQKRARIILRAR